jgi:hypothetical protein
MTYNPVDPITVDELQEIINTCTTYAELVEKTHQIIDHEVYLPFDLYVYPEDGRTVLKCVDGEIDLTLP